MWELVHKGQKVTNNYTNPKSFFGLDELNPEIVLKNGMAYYHNINFGSSKNFKSQSLGKSASMPNHNLAITDMLLLEYKGLTNLVTSSEDGLIKIWE